jgi:hypothetical protein
MLQECDILSTGILKFGSVQLSMIRRILSLLGVSSHVVDWGPVRNWSHRHEAKIPLCDCTSSINRPLQSGLFDGVQMQQPPHSYSSNAFIMLINLLPSHASFAVNTLALSKLWRSAFSVVARVNMLPRTIPKYPAKGHSLSCYKVSALAMRNFASNFSTRYISISSVQIRAKG